jgi:predicted nucleic acid-binding protein
MTEVDRPFLDTNLKRTGEEIRAALAQIIQSFEVVAVSANVIDEAVSLRHKHQVQFWDALHIATARAVGCSSFLTEDLPGIQSWDGLRILSPLSSRVGGAG